MLRRCELQSHGFLQTIQNQMDRKFQQYYLTLIIALLILTTWTFVYRTISAGWDGWIVGDWLINYAAGFVRRGITGQLILNLAESTGIELQPLVYALQIGAWCVFSVFYLIQIKNKHISFFYFLLCIFPAFLLFYVNDPVASGRKEILLLALFAVWVFLLDQQKSLSFTQIVVIWISYTVVCLAHELAIFYSPYFLYSLRLKGKVDFKFQTCGAGLLCIAILSLIAILTNGSNVRSPEICTRIIALGAATDVCLGIMSWPNQSAAYLINHFFNTFSTYKMLGLILSYLLITIPSFLFEFTNSQNKQSMRKRGLIISAMFIITLPIFVLATDWGRFIHIHFALLVLAFSISLTNRSFKVSDRSECDGEVNSLASPGWFVFCGVIMIGGSFFWRVPHCCARVVDPIVPAVLHDFRLLFSSTPLH